MLELDEPDRNRPHNLVINHQGCEKSFLLRLFVPFRPQPLGSPVPQLWRVTSVADQYSHQQGARQQRPAALQLHRPHQHHQHHCGKQGTLRWGRGSPLFLLWFIKRRSKEKFLPLLQLIFIYRSRCDWREEPCLVTTELPSFTSTGEETGGLGQSTPLMENASPWRYTHSLPHT